MQSGARKGADGHRIRSRGSPEAICHAAADDWAHPQASGQETSGWGRSHRASGEKKEGNMRRPIRAMLPRLAVVGLGGGILRANREAKGDAMTVKRSSSFRRASSLF